MVWINLQSSLHWPFSRIAQSIFGNRRPIRLKWGPYPPSPPKYSVSEGDSIRKEHTVIVCEGNFDAISLNQAGLTYAVAPFGTAFTSEQAGLLSRYADRVQLLFDSDNAGQEATAKAITMLQEKDIQSGVLSLDRFKDASEYLEKAGAEELRKALGQSTDGFRYLVNRALNLYNTRTPKGKSEFV